MSLPSASSLPRVMACPQSHRLPQAELPPSTQSSLGIAVHLWLSDGIIPADEGAQAVCDAIARVLPDAEWRHEVTLAYDAATDTGRELGQDLARDYSSALPTEWVGTVDGLAMVGDMPTVLELKTGYRTVGIDSWQIRMLALAAARAANTDSVEVLLVTAHPDEARVERHVFDALALDEAVVALEQLAVRLQTDSPTKPGEHCRYCPALASCPSMTAIMRGAAANEPHALATPEVATQAYELLKALKTASARLEAELEAYALQQPIQLASGDSWGWREKPKLEFLPGAAHELRAMYGSKGANAVSESVSKTSITRALGKRDGEAAIERLRASGAAREKLVGGFGVLKGSEE